MSNGMSIMTNMFNISIHVNAKGMFVMLKFRF